MMASRLCLGIARMHGVDYSLDINALIIPRYNSIE